MRGDLFFDSKECMRCSKPLASRILSWFNSDVICMTCCDKEREVRKALPDHGKNYEGCGYIPEIKVEASHGRS